MVSDSSIIALGSGVELVKAQGGAGYKGALFERTLPASDWKGIGWKLHGIEGSLMWILGDWINFGEEQAIAAEAKARADAKGGEKPDLRGKYAWAVQATGMKYSTLRTAASVCRRVSLARRRGSPLTFEHHREVVPYGLEDQERFLDLAERTDLSVAKLRKAIRKEFQERDGPKVDVGFVPAAWMQPFVRWAKGQDFSTWTADRRAQLKEQLKPVIECYNAL